MLLSNGDVPLRNHTIDNLVKNKNKHKFQQSARVKYMNENELLPANRKWGLEEVSYTNKILERRRTNPLSIEGLYTVSKVYVWGRIVDLTPTVNQC